MRELKFRVFIEDWGNAEPSHKMVYLQEGELGTCILNWELGGYKSAVFQQYTGLKDKNGRDIYEGDILSSDNNEKPCNYIVKWNDEKFNYAGFVLNAVMKNPPEITAFIHDFKLWMTIGFTIIGNIHENPSLLT